MYFQKPGRNSKYSKTWKKFKKPGENFQKSFGHPIFIFIIYFKDNKTVFIKFKQCSGRGKWVKYLTLRFNNIKIA